MIKENILKIQNEIQIALQTRKSDKETGSKVDLLAVSKTHSADMVQEAVNAGQIIFGENKVQEAIQKIPLVQGAKWHLIGHLQTNKVKKAVELFDIIYSIDSKRLLLAIDKEAKKINKVQEILIQINVAQEESKFGIDQNEILLLLEKVEKLKNIHLSGFMVIAPESDDMDLVRTVFKTGYELFCKAKNVKIANIDMQILSMGMSNDFKLAIEEGSNNVRLGTSVFGNRNYDKL